VNRAFLKSLRFRLFVALAASTLAGALATGLYATAVDAETLGFAARLLRVAPKGLALASVLVPVAALVSAWIGGRLARSVEELSLAASRIAEGERSARVPPGDGNEARRLSRALVALRREVADKPYAAAALRDAWHDLKTPLAAICATLEVLEDGAVDDPAVARSFLENLRRSTAQLEARLEEVVTLARFETSALDAARPTGLRDLIGGAMHAMEPLASALHVELQTGPLSDGRICCDEVALARALANLLENAVEASPGGFVRVDIDDRSARSLRVDVTNGPGEVPIELRGRLFERAATSGKAGGSGLGLAIARAAVEAHGGTVSFLELGPPRVAVRIELPR
jgi:signal transduction histidine kinase